MTEAPPFTIQETPQQKESLSSRPEQCVDEIIIHIRDIVIKRGFKTDAYDFITPSVTKIMGYTVDDKPMSDFDHRLERIHPEDKNG